MSKNHGGRRNPSPPPAIARQDSISTVSYSGPLPPPGILRQFEEIIPGSAERILRAFEVESSHRRNIEGAQAGLATHALKHELTDRRIGLIFGFVVALGALGISAATILAGHPVGGASGIVATVASLATVFIVGRKIQAGRETPEDKQMQLPHTDE